MSEAKSCVTVDQTKGLDIHLHVLNAGMMDDRRLQSFININLHFHRSIK